MSFARSLLALTALAALAATAQSDCITKDFGQITSNTVPLSQVLVPPDGGELTIPIETCNNYGHPGNAVGERVTACNAGGHAPNLRGGDVVHVVVDCGTPSACPNGITVDTTLYCP